MLIVDNSANSDAGSDARVGFSGVGPEQSTSRNLRAGCIRIVRGDWPANHSETCIRVSEFGRPVRRVKTVFHVCIGEKL